MGGKLIRTVGLVPARLKIELMNLMYNFTTRFDPLSFAEATSGLRERKKPKEGQSDRRRYPKRGGGTCPK